MKIEENEQYFIEIDDKNIVTYKTDKLRKIECNFDFKETQFKEIGRAHV